MNKNTERVKRWRERNVKMCECGNRMAYDSSKCKNCSPQASRPRIEQLTLEQLQRKIGEHPSWKNVQVREYARSWHKALLELPCASCGYELHVELAHIRDISTFPPDALVGQVNARENVIQLCRNCHWEFDHGYILADLKTEGKNWCA